MITTLTPNPSLDRTVALPALRRGAVLRATGVSAEPSGKGVNVALALARQGVPAVAVLPAGGPTGALVLQLLEAESRGVAARGGPGSLRLDAVPVAGDVRVGTSLREPDGTVTKVNEPGPELTAGEVDALLTAVRRALGDPARGAGRGTRWLATCGSLPPGAPGDLHALAVRAAHDAGAAAVVDSSGDALLAALSAAPDLVAPNAHELAEATGRPLRTVGDVVAAAEVLRGAGAGAVLVSLGGDGAVLVDGGDALHATAPVARVLSTVGAGDALLAGYLASARAGRGGADRLAEAVRWGAAAVQSASTLFALDAGSSSGVQPVTVTDAEPALTLGEPADPPT